MTFAHAPLFHDKIGLYGVGFKTGSMAHAEEALVLSKVQEDGKSYGVVGILSHSFCDECENIKTPILSYDLDACTFDHSATGVDEFWDVLRRFVPFTEGLLVKQFEQIQQTGTQIYLLTLRKEGNIGQLDPDTDQEDIRLPMCNGVPFRQKLEGRHRANTVPMDFSLRAYCAVMFLRPKMKIVLRGSHVKQFKELP